MSAGNGSSTWGTSDEPLLNVPQTERRDDEGEHSEVRSTDLERSLPQSDSNPPLTESHRTGPPSSATAEAPLVSPEADAQAREAAKKTPDDKGSR